MWEKLKICWRGVKHQHVMSRPNPRFDPNGRSEPSPGRETIYWDSLISVLVPVGIQTISVLTKKSHLHIQTNYHRSGVHQNLYTYTESLLLIHVLFLLNIFCSSGIQNIIILFHRSLHLIQTLIHIHIYYKT